MDIILRYLVLVQIRKIIDLVIFYAGIKNIRTIDLLGYVVLRESQLEAANWN